MPQVPSDGASAQKEFLTFKSGRSSRRSRGKPARHGSARGCRVLEMIGTPGKTHSAWRHLIGPAPLGVLAARHRLLAAARAQPIYEPSCRQACDDHAHADEHINENDGNAAVDVHGGPNLEPLLFDDKRRLIPGGYRSSYRAVAIRQLDRLDDLGAALSSPGGQMAELPVLSNCARAVAVEQVNGKQVREMS